MVAFVYFLREPRTLTEDTLRAIVARELDIEVSGDERDEYCVEEVEVPPSPDRPKDAFRCFIVRLRDAVFSVTTCTLPYVDDPEELGEEMQDPEALEILAAHTAWLSVDCMDEVETETQWAMAYAVIGRIMAGLAGPDCVGLYNPEINYCLEYDDSMLELLRSDAPLMLFDEGMSDPVIFYDGDDERINAAVDEARARFPEFVAAFQTKTTDEPPFAIKAKFEDGGMVKYMWVVVTRIEGDAIHGILDSEPRELATVESGDPVRVSVEEIYDWIYPDGEDIAGAFTMRVMEEELED